MTTASNAMEAVTGMPPVGKVQKGEGPAER